MRGAWGKPYGTVARVNIGQIILSIRCKEATAPVVMEALRRARYKFPGRQKIIVSKKWGFTNVNKVDYLKLKEDKRVLQYVLHVYPEIELDLTALQGWCLRPVHPPQGQPRAESPQPAPCLIASLRNVHHTLYLIRLHSRCPFDRLNEVIGP